MSIDLSSLALGAQKVGSTSCNLDWSPMQTEISFITGCNGLTALPAEREVYIWSLVENKVEKVTDFTTDKNTTTVDATYSTFWYTPETLLIGVAYYEGSNTSQQTQTLLYSLVTKSSLALSEQKVEQFSVNPVTGELIVRLVSPLSSTNTVDGSIGMIASANPSSTLSNISRLATMPAGCNLQWSSDGVQLAYTIHAGNNCIDRVEKFVFTTSDMRTSIEYNPYDVPSQKIIAIIELGWLSKK